MEHCLLSNSSCCMAEIDNIPTTGSLHRSVNSYLTSIASTSPMRFCMTSLDQETKSQERLYVPCASVQHPRNHHYLFLPPPPQGITGPRQVCALAVDWQRRMRLRAPAPCRQRRHDHIDSRCVRSAGMGHSPIPRAAQISHHSACAYIVRCLDND